MGVDLTTVTQDAAQNKVSKTEEMPLHEKMREELNTAIVKESVTVSLSSQNEPLALLFKSVVDKLNEVLEPELGEDAIQNAVSQDNTPEGTASRIISQSTSFYGAFKQNHQGENPDDMLNQFMSLIREGIDRGFSGARGILKDLDVLKDDIATDIDKTYELVTQGLAEFESEQLKDA